MSILNLNHALNAYLAVTLAPSSRFLADPPALAAAVRVDPPIPIAYVGPAGQISDVLLLSVRKEDWERAGAERVVRGIEGVEGVRKVDVQVLKQRAKRGGDEL